MTILYEIALPTYPNPASHVSGSHISSREEWLGHALNLAGGYTELGIRTGAWRSDDGRIYKEPMHWYQLACTAECMSSLVDIAFELFPDQEAIFYAVVGRAVIMPRRERDTDQKWR